MTENPVIKVIDRLTRLAQLDGTAYCQVTWDAESETFHFTMLPKEQVEVNYGEKNND